MEIKKQSESFVITDSTDELYTNGTISHEISGTLNMQFNVNDAEGIYMGSCSYNNYGDSSNISFNINCSEEKRDHMISYSNTIIDEVLEYFKQND